LCSKNHYRGETTPIAKFILQDMVLGKADDTVQLIRLT